MGAVYSALCVYASDNELNIQVAYMVHRRKLFLCSGNDGAENISGIKCFFVVVLGIAKFMDGILCILKSPWN